MASAQIIQELRHIRKGLAGIMEQMGRIKIKLLFIAGLMEIRVLERGNAQKLLSLPDKQCDLSLKSERNHDN